MKNKVKTSELTGKELDTQIEDTYKELRECRFRYSTVRSIDNPKIFRKLRKKLAVLLTERSKRAKSK
jgi:ribosomal protein L29